MAVHAGLSRRLVEMITKAMQAEGCTPEQVESVLDRMIAQLKEMAEGAEFVTVETSGESPAGFMMTSRPVKQESS